MRLITQFKFLLALILPILTFLLVLKLIAFDSQFYQKKFAEYGVEKDIHSASELHIKVISFITGKSNKLPDEFNEREIRHLVDVRRLLKLSTIVIYCLGAIFLIVLLTFSLILKDRNLIANFIGKVLIFGGLLTLIIASILILFITSDFSAIFDRFHNLLFEKGTYIFDPAKELIVNLYPQQLFLDLGIKISKVIILISLILILLGSFLLKYFKAKEIKREANKS